MSAPSVRLGDTSPPRAVAVLWDHVGMSRAAVMAGVFRLRLVPRVRWPSASAPLSRRSLAGGRKFEENEGRMCGMKADRLVQAPFSDGFTVEHDVDHGARFAEV